MLFQRIFIGKVNFPVTTLLNSIRFFKESESVKEMKERWEKEAIALASKRKMKAKESRAFLMRKSSGSNSYVPSHRKKKN